ncbi:MAG TPA: hypothetical protein VE338_21315 [Ktedonobacterales bacterium]|nr:hypothetical protein [Ktedonobacterales bacterium]
MDAIDREPTRKTPQTQVADRATVVVKRVSQTTSRLSAPRATSTNDDVLVTVITPTRIVAPTAPIRAPRGNRPVLNRTLRFAVAVACIAAVLGVALGYNVLHSSGQSGDNVASAVPPPSGRGPITASVGVIVAAPAPQSVHSTGTVSPYQSQTAFTTTGGSVAAKGLLSLEPCHDTSMFVSNISEWTVPPGCYANIYVPNRANYVQAASWGYCNWWVEVTHPNAPNITYGNYVRGTTPVAGAAIFFDGGEQGADSAGHWAEAVAVSSDHYWVLISEMNFAWRGGGFGKIDYRYIHVSPHVHFLYGV